METVVCFAITTCFIQLNGRGGVVGGAICAVGMGGMGGMGGVPAVEGCGSAPDSGYAWRQLKFGTCVMGVH